MRNLVRTLILIVAVVTSGCVPAGIFIKAVAIDVAGKIIYTTAEKNISFQQVEKFFDSVIKAVFNDVIDNTSSKVEVVPLINDKLKGRMVKDPKYLVKGSRNKGSLTVDAEIKVDKNDILFSRETELSEWELTSESKNIINYRLDIGSLQLALQSLGYECKSIDGILGKNTRSQLRKFQKNRGLKNTGEFDSATREALMVL